MQNAYYGYTFQNGIYIIGFEIDKQGNNTPTLARVSDADRVPKYWAFNNVLQEIFMLDGRLHLLDMDGEVRKLENEVWRKLPLKLKNNSRIIDTENGILTCYPSSFFKASTAYGGCYNVNDKWKIEANWRDTVPKMCNGYLIVLDAQQKILTLKKYSPSNGELLTSKVIKKAPDDLCLVDLP